MGKQIDKSVIYTSFDKSEKEQWLFKIASGNTEYKTIPKKSSLMKTALEFYLDCVGIKFNATSVEKVIPKELENSSKIEKPIEKEKIVESPKDTKEVVKKIEVVNNSEQNIQDEELNIIG